MVMVQVDEDSIHEGELSSLKPRSQCYVRPCIPFRNVVAEYCERNLRITARTCGAYGGLRKDRAMFYPYVAHVTDDQSKYSKFSPRGGVHNSSELRYNYTEHGR